MREARLFADAAGIDELLHHGVIARAVHDAALADEIEAAVADVHPVRVPVLHDAGDKHRARRIGKAALRRVAQDRRVARGDRAIEKIARVAEARLRLALEGGAEQPYGELGRHLPVRMAAETVGHRHEHAFGGRPVADAVLVDAARADAGLMDECVVHLPRSPREFFRCQTNRASPPPSPLCAGSFSPRSAFCSASTLCGRSR